MVGWVVLNSGTHYPAATLGREAHEEPPLAGESHVGDEEGAGIHGVHV